MVSSVGQSDWPLTNRSWVRIPNCPPHSGSRPDDLAATRRARMLPCQFSSVWFVAARRQKARANVATLAGCTLTDKALAYERVTKRRSGRRTNLRLTDKRAQQDGGTRVVKGICGGGIDTRKQNRLSTSSFSRGKGGWHVSTGQISREANSRRL